MDQGSPSTETYVSTAPPTSAASDKAEATPSPKDSAKRKKKPDKSHPWRDNIEAIAISIVTIVLFKYFVLEAYKIPTGSMQPTLMGNAETGIYDRVIVDKISYHFRDPERFEIAVFKYPLDSSKNFIKRILGMPNETLWIDDGDLFVQKNGESEGSILRRPRPIQAAQLRRLETEGEWLPQGGALGAWKIDSSDSGDEIVAKPPRGATFPVTSSVQFPRGSAGIIDQYLDGYPDGMKDPIRNEMSRTNKRHARNEVSDLRVAAEIDAEAGCAEVVIVLHEGSRRFRFVFPGPAAPAGDVARIQATGLDPMVGDGGTLARSEDEFRLEAGDAVDVEVQNLNDRLEMRIDGDLVASLEIPPAPSNPTGNVSIEVTSTDPAGEAVLDDVKVWRDIYYTSGPQQKTSRWEIPEGHYVVLGDNSQDSSDGRDWTYARYEILDGDNKGEIVRGNLREGPVPRPDSNPKRVPHGSDFQTIYFMDDKGERHVWDRSEVRELPHDVENAPFVPRELIRGRAVIVVWPLAPQHDVYRWKWVR